MRKVTKGEYAYLSWHKKREIVKTAVMFGISGAIFLMGYLTVKSQNNLLTVVAILGCLPASKSAVSMMMNLKVKGCSLEEAKEIQSRFGEGFGVYNLYFTSYQKNYEIHHLTVKGLSVIAFTADVQTEAAAFEEHIRTILKQDGKLNYNVKLYQDLTKYISRVEQLIALDKDNGKEEEVLSTLFSVSL